MKRALSILVVASLAYSNQVLAQATNPPSQEATRGPQTQKDDSSSVRLTAILKQLSEVRERQREVAQAEADLMRAVKVGGGVFFLSAATFATLIKVARRGEPTGKISGFLAMRGVQSVGVPTTGMIAMISGGVTGYEIYQISRDLAQSRAELDQEETDLVNLYQTAVVR